MFLNFQTQNLVWYISSYDILISFLFLGTLRISDVTMKRMYHILRILRENRIILTSLKLVRAIQEKDAEEGYPFKVIFSAKKKKFC